jgi:ankyrin repeat protein
MSADPTPAGRRALALRCILLAVLILAGFLILRSQTSSPPAPTPAAPPDRAELDRALPVAIRDGNHAMVRRLLDQGADANARDPAGETALMQAALNADAEMVRLLLDRGADVNARSPVGTALLRAIHDPGKVELLCDHGARVDKAMVFAALVPGSRPVLESLLRHGGRVNDPVAGFTALMQAARGGDLEAVTWLLAHGADVHATGPNGYTAVIAAAFAGDADILGLLLDRGEDPNTRSSELPAGNG